MKSLSKLHQEAIIKAQNATDQNKAAAMAMIERPIETFSDEQLLFELVRRNGFQRAAKKTEYWGEGWVTSVVGIGKDHSVSITMDEDDFKELSVLAIIGFEAKLKEKNGG